MRGEGKQGQTEDEAAEVAEAFLLPLEAAVEAEVAEDVAIPDEGAIEAEVAEDEGKVAIPARGAAPRAKKRRLEGLGPHVFWVWSLRSARVPP